MGELKGEELERKHKEEVENMEQKIAETVLKKKNLWDEVNTLQARMGSSSTVSITECYVCFEPMKPPIHIFTCGIGGHAVCELSQPDESKTLWSVSVYFICQSHC